MRKLALIAALLLLFGCATEPPITEGTVKDRKFEAAHWEGGWDTVPTVDCGNKYNYTTKAYEYRCESSTTQVWDAHDYWVTDRYKLQLEACERLDSGAQKCRRDWRTVPRTEYESYRVGQHYPSTGDR